MNVACKTHPKEKYEPRNTTFGVSNESNYAKFYHGWVCRPWLATDHEKRNENAPASDYYLLRKGSAVYMYLYRNLQSALAIMSKT